MDSAAQIQPRSTYDAQDWAPTDDNFKVGSKRALDRWDKIHC